MCIRDSGIFDIVSTGATLLNNGLEEVETLMKSQAVLIANKDLDPDKQQLLEDLLFRIDAVLNAKNRKYIMLNAPKGRLEEIIAILPKVKSPTIMNLQDDNWVAIHAVMTEDEFWEVVRPLEKIGATGILSVPIEKIIPRIE